MILSGIKKIFFLLLEDFLNNIKKMGAEGEKCHFQTFINFIFIQYWPFEILFKYFLFLFSFRRAEN